jgi:hypothetical protein
MRGAEGYTGVAGLGASEDMGMAFDIERRGGGRGELRVCTYNPRRLCAASSMFRTLIHGIQTTKGQ